jgi:cell division protein FtsA
MDLQATKIQVVVAEKIVNDNIRILADATVDYAGYVAGEFLDEGGLGDAISSVFNMAQDIYGRKIDSVVVGVPSEFCNYALRNLKADYSNKVVIKKRHIDELFATVKDDEIADDYTVISKSPILYILDDGVQTLYPESEYTKMLGSKASCILVKNSFINIISDILETQGVKDCTFVPVALAVDSMLLDEDVRQSGVVVVDFDYVSTSVTSFMGEGIVDLKTFPIGEGHVLADLVEVMKIGYFVAEELKKQLILTLQPNPMDVYEVVDESKTTTKLSASIANEIVLARIDDIADIINNILINFQYRQDLTRPIYITGSGLTGIKGIKNYLSKKLNRKCYLLSPKQVMYAKPKYSHLIGLIKFAITSNI